MLEDTVFDIVLSLTVGGSSLAMTVEQKEALKDMSVGGLMYEMVEINGMGAEIGAFKGLKSTIKLLKGSLPREEAVEASGRLRIIDLEDEVALDIKEEGR